MDITQALEIVQDHIRIGKGMELTNGVPEALEIVVEQLAITEKALELAVVNGKLCGCCPAIDSCGDDDNCIDQLSAHFLAQAKAGAADG